MLVDRRFPSARKRSILVQCLDHAYIMECCCPLQLNTGGILPWNGRIKIQWLWTWWHTPVIPTLGRWRITGSGIQGQPGELVSTKQPGVVAHTQRQSDVCEIEASLVHMVSFSQLGLQGNLVSKRPPPTVKCPPVITTLNKNEWQWLIE